MKLILNVDAITPPLTGIGHYALRLARGLRQHPTMQDIRFFSAYRWLEDPEHALVANRSIAQLRYRIPFKPLALNLYGKARSVVFLWQTRSLQNYLLHSPNYILLPFHGPAVTTIHDLSYLHYPRHHPKERIVFMEQQMPRTLRQATAIICDSAFVRHEIIDILGVPAANVFTVPLGADDAFQPYDPVVLQPLLARYQLTETPYLLVVATLEPRKNLLQTVKAYLRLPVMLRDRHPLVLVGAPGWLTEELQQYLEPLERAGQVRRLGYVVQEDLPLLYAGAFAFAYPSLYEGFGLPVLEAMACGVPVLTSDRSSLPEVAGDAALLVNPDDVDAITMGLEKLLTDTDWRSSAAEKGLRQARQFSWERCVEETVAVYHQALAR